jgi:hypothetical protein
MVRGRGHLAYRPAVKVVKELVVQSRPLEAGVARVAACKLPEVPAQLGEHRLLVVDGPAACAEPPRLARPAYPPALRAPPLGGAPPLPGEGELHRHGGLELRQRDGEAGGQADAAPAPPPLYPPLTQWRKCIIFLRNFATSVWRSHYLYCLSD